MSTEKEHNSGVMKYFKSKTLKLVKNRELKDQVDATHRPIYLSTRQEMRLYCFRKINFYCRRSCPKITRTTTIFNEGERRIDHSLDILKIIKDLKYLKIIVMENKVGEKVQNKDAPVICVVCYKFYGNAK